MGKVDNSRIEEIAVDTVNTYMSEKTRRISGQLEKSDTGISIDGELIFYLEKERKVSTYGGEIPVQVKGQTVQKISENTSAYRKFDKDTYVNFLKLDGVLVFVVEELFDDDLIKEKQIFYKYLDVVELISILSDFEKSGNKTKTLHLDKLDTHIDFDEIIDEIHRIRRKMPAALGLYTSSNKKNINLDNNILQNLEGVLEDVKKEIRQSDFYDEKSEFLKQAVPRIKDYLSKDFVFDYEDAVILASSFIINDNYQLLQKETKNLVLLFLAKISNYQKNYENAKSKLNEINNLDNIYKYYYEREKYVADITLLDDANVFDCLAKVQWQNETDKELYRLLYRVESMRISTNELKKISCKNDNFRYLVGIGYANNFNYLDASKVFSEIKENTTIKILEIMNYLRVVTEEVLFEDNYSKIEKLKIYQKEMKEKLVELEQKNLTLEQGDLVHNLMLSMTDPQLFIDKELGKTEEDDKIIIQSLIITKNYQKVIDYLIGKNLTDFNFLLFLFFSLVKDKQYNIVISKINTMIHSEVKIPEAFFELLGDYLIDALINLNETEKLYNVEELKKEYYFISDIHCMKIYLYKAEMKKKFLDKELIDIDIFVKEVKSELEIGLLCSFISKYNNIQFTKKVWEELKDDYYEEFSEVVSVVMLREGSKENLIFALDVIKWTERYCVLSKKLIMIECQIFSMLEQYKAILNRISNLEEKDEDILNLQVIAQIHLEDETDIEQLFDMGVASNHLDFKLNSGLGLMIFGIDPVKGSKILLKELIETNFQNVDLGKNFVLQSLNSLREYSHEKELSKISGKRFYYYELIHGKQIKKILTIPSEWDTSDLYGYETITNTNTIFYLLTSKEVNGSIKINNKNYKVSKKIPLSQYVYNKMIQHCMGGVKSDSLIRSFSIEGKDFSEITTFMEKENENKLSVIEEMKKFNFTGFLQFICSEEDVIPFMQAMYNDPEYFFDLGKIVVAKGCRMQLSLSSLILIKKYELEEVIQDNPDICIDLEIQQRIEKLIKKETNQGYDIKRMHIFEGQPVIIERTEEEYYRQLYYLNELLEIVNSIKNKNESMFIDPQLKEVFRYDACSVQSSIDNSNLLLIEDSVIQKIYDSISVLGIVHNYFINAQSNIEKYIDFLLALDETNNLYSISFPYKLEIAQKVLTQNKNETLFKYRKWIKNQMNKNINIR